MNELIKIKAEDFGLTDEKGLSIMKAFDKPMGVLRTLEDEFNEVIGLDEKLPENTPKFKALLKKYSKNDSSEFVPIHKFQKAEYWNGGKYVDEIKKLGIGHSKSRKDILKEKADYLANLEIARLEKLHKERFDKLKVYGVEFPPVGLREMESTMFDMVLTGAKKTFEDAEQAKIDRIAVEKAEKEKADKLVEDNKKLVETNKKLATENKTIKQPPSFSGFGGGVSSGATNGEQKDSLMSDFISLKDKYEFTGKQYIKMYDDVKKLIDKTIIHIKEQTK